MLVFYKFAMYSVNLVNPLPGRLALIFFLNFLLTLVTYSSATPSNSNADNIQHVKLPLRQFGQRSVDQRPHVSIRDAHLPQKCPDKNDTDAKLGEIKEMTVKLLGKVNEFGKLNNKTKTKNMKISSSSTKEQPSSVHPSTLASPRVPTSVLPNAVETSSKSEQCRSNDTSKTSQTEHAPQSPAKQRMQKSLNVLEPVADHSCAASERESRGQTWDHWTAWSGCSATCGKGRQVRWRHCTAKECPVADAEMEEKICQLPACGTGKFLRIF